MSRGLVNRMLLWLLLRRFFSNTCLFANRFIVFVLQLLSYTAMYKLV